MNCEKYLTFEYCCFVFNDYFIILLFCMKVEKALHKINKSYLNGVSNIQYALEWYEKSAEQGYDLQKKKVKLLNKEGFYIDDRQKKSPFGIAIHFTGLVPKFRTGLNLANCVRQGSFCHAFLDS
ncbi:hypothetical protein K501DRAFT_265429 [Backusella circina FSU 941]|nr:hypothetical protein K501DRAFT_265429 [Backusella circina FSU 941]